ncbi:MAG: T9SS type A sorting domain-containing protein [Bacteroidetes bacterium]|nr:T9SS type A sorting domain-containing protein [Bacteroidota bacterium]MCK5766545.1 T9SS type A sorting domain-containing protein [Bacteroidales bacterium]
MNNLILFFCFILITNLAAISQGIVSEENQWNVLVNEYISGDIDTEIWNFEGDTIINGHVYKMIRGTYYALGGHFLGGYLRENSNKVFYIHPDGDAGTLYDFNLEVGDTCSIITIFYHDQEFNVYITDIDTVEYFGIQRKRWSLIDDYGNEDYWVAGIGSSDGPIHTMMQRGNPPYLSWDLLCFHHNDTLRFIKEGFSECYISHVGIEESYNNMYGIVIFPNPARDKFEVRSAEFGVEKIELFDIMGRKVEELDFPLHTTETEVDVSHLEPGSYFCRICTRNKSITKKILIR